MTGSLAVAGSAAYASVRAVSMKPGDRVAGELDVPIAATFPLDDVRAAFKLLEQGHSQGKIALL